MVINMGAWLGNANENNWVQRRRHLDQSQQCICLPLPPTIGIFVFIDVRNTRSINSSSSINRTLVTYFQFRPGNVTKSDRFAIFEDLPYPAGTPRHDAKSLLPSAELDLSRPHETSAWRHLLSQSSVKVISSSARSVDEQRTRVPPLKLKLTLILIHKLKLTLKLKIWIHPI
ncbi:unnamed protein product [Nesidiocoris tenuis]|uniref:Uncharacterized protein n=1 Tax=Nesidiocoris tenuis TaxID=355587 RepID=A0A6H5HA11_9HEMI|nr:unnamed protein product [Nesidiocoris tenuis]